MKTKAFREALLNWYRIHKRDLPWRRSHRPYHIWVSEVMLQQTQVTTVIPYYRRFLARFPTLAALASANIDDVLPYWSGLGYYRRIRNFHAAARLVLERHCGRIPTRLEELLALPGIGRYTAGAILSIAYGQPQPILDGNVIRILCRIFGIQSDPRTSAARKKLWALASVLVPSSGAADFNQALMDLGAMVCVARRPLCPQCPVYGYCQARKQGLAEQLPAAGRSSRKIRLAMVAVLLERKGRILVLRRSHPSLMQGLWEVPTIELDAGKSFDPDVAAELFQQQCGLKITQPEEIGRTRHAITFRRIALHIFRAKLRGSSHRRDSSGCKFRWIAAEDVDRLGFSSLSLKAIRHWSNTKLLPKPRDARRPGTWIRGSGVREFGRSQF